MASIAILLPDLRGGGAERVNLDLAHEFLRLGHAVDLVLMRAQGEYLAEARSAFPIVNMGVDSARKVPRALARYVRQSRPDAVLASMWPLTVMAVAGRALSGHRCRLVTSEHNTLSVQYRSWGQLHRLLMRITMAIGYRFADARVGVSAGVTKDLAHLAAMRNDKFRVIHNPVPIRRKPALDRVAAIDSLWDAPHGARILGVGSFKKQKNHSLLIRAFARLDSSAKLMLLGKGEGEAELRILTTELGIAERVIFAGFHADPTVFYETADLFVLSSDYEGFGNVIVEALACGTPVVSTDCPSGPAEILDGGRYGRLTAVGDEEALAIAIGDALKASPDPEVLRARARDFSPNNAAMRYLALLA